MNADLKKIYNKNIYIFEEEYLLKLIPKVQKKGHLINLTDYNNLKNMTQYDKSKKHIYISADSSKIMNQKKLTPIKGIKLKTSRYLINMLCNDNEFILISSDLWKFIGEGKENDNQFPYTIDNNNKLVITFDDKKLTFIQNDKTKKNIINNQNIVDKNSNIKEINSFYKTINDYYIFEEKFINKLKQSNNEQKFGCLVEKNWFDKWLKYFNYKEIKEKYKKQINEKEIKDDLIYNLEKNNYFKHSDLRSINIIFPKKKEELESFLEKGSLVIVESNFCKSFTEKEMSDNLRYRAYNNKIEIVFNNGSFITKSNDNIISRISDDNLKNNNNISSVENIILMHLEQFIKYIYFKNQINNEIKSNHKVLQKNEIDKKIIYLVNKDIINNYKNYFDYDKLYGLLKKNKNLKKSEYFAQNFSNLDNELQTYLNEIKKKESINFDGISNDLKEVEYKNSSNQRIKYFIDFDIINKEFNSFLIENNIFKKEQAIKGTYIDGENKILIYIEYKDKSYYEIGYLDSNEDLVIEYKVKSIHKDKILNHFGAYGIEKVINNTKEGYIKLNGGEKIGEFYKIIKTENKEKNNQNKNIISNINNNNKTSNQIAGKENPTNDNSNDDKDSKFIIDIFSILFSIKSFEKNIQNKSEILQNNYFENNNKQNKYFDNYFLINKNFFNSFKKLFYDDKVNKYLKKWENESFSKVKDIITKIIKTNEFDQCKNFILSKRNNDIFKSDILEIEKEEFIIDKTKYYYPNNFNFLSQEVFSSILNVSNEEREDLDKNLLLNIVLNKDKIYLQYNNEDYFNKHLFFIYEFSLINNNQFSLDYKFESILASPYKEKLNKYFEIINNKNDNYKIKNNTITFQNSEICKIIKIPNQNEEKTENKQDTENKSISNQEVNCLIKFEDNKQYKKNTIEGKKEEFKISEILEVLISLVANNIFIKKFSENIKNKKIFLLDNKIIEIFSEEFKELKTIFNEDTNSKNNIDNIINNKSSNKSQLSINSIIFNLNKEKLKKLDEKILKSKKKILLKKNSEKLSVIDKNIIIYKDFILVFEHIYDNIKKYFDNSINQQDINYSSHKNEDILTINTEDQNTILIGKLDSHNSSFDIKYIFEYNSYNLFDKEKNIILAGNINNYIENKTIFEKNKKEEYLSPIISENKLIGYGYIYKENKRYDKYFNFYKILSWDKIKNSINLYYNYKSIDEKLSKSKSRSERQTYYIINKNMIVDIKNNNDFKKIYELLEKNDINENDDNSNKSILLALKNLSEEELKSFKKQYNNKIKYSINDFSPNVNSAKYFEKVEKNIIIYNDFEIIRKDIIEKLIDNIKDMNSLLLECIFIDEKIIINYPDNLNGNKFVSVIGKLNYDKTFVTEYILIYNSRTDKQSHILSISNRLKNYLKGLQIYNNCDVITDSFFHEIGTIAKCDVNDYDYDDNNYNRGNYNSGNNDNNVYESSKNQNINIFNAKSTITRKTNKFSNVTKLENDYQLDFRPTFPHIRKNFNCCPKIGLQNIGATCYMNATLQCFCHIEKFLDYFKYSQKVKDITRNNKNSLTSSFKLLIENLWPNFQTSKKDYAPEEFKNKISKMNPLFKGVAANDAKDLVNFIIMTLHEELNSKTNNTTVTPFNNNMMMIQQTNQQVMLNNFVQNFQQSNDSMISGLFYGINCNITQCGFCKTQTYNYQTYFFIVFPLEEVRKFKINNLNNNYNNFQMNQLNFYNNQINYNNNINEVSLWDCFDYDWKINEMSGTNSMYCNYCKRTCTSQMRTVLTTGPRILILLLNRGKGIEFNVKINFTEQLNISKYLQFNNQGFLYQLIGVISHLGESGMGGHFIAYCRDPITGQWNKYNDSIVTVVDNFQNEVINFAMPYLLFYQQIDNNR